MPGNADDTAIVKTILAMAQVLELEVVAEGVETHAQFELLRQLECDTIQGFLLGKPMSGDDFLDFVEQNRAEKKDKDNG